MKRVVVTGLGCISPLGNSVDAMWNGLLNGKCAIDYIKKINAERLTVKVAAEVLDFKPEDFNIDKAMIRHNDVYALYADSKLATTLIRLVLAAPSALALVASRLFVANMHRLWRMVLVVFPHSSSPR